MYPVAAVNRRPVATGHQHGQHGQHGHRDAYRDPYGPRGHGYLSDQSILKKLRLRVDTDDPQFPALKKLKIRGKDLNDLPPEVFEINELEVS